MMYLLMCVLCVPLVAWHQMQMRISNDLNWHPYSPSTSSSAYLLCNYNNCNYSTLRMCVFFFARLIFKHNLTANTIFVDCDTIFIICFVCFFFQLANVSCFACVCCNTRHNCVRRLFIFHTINISTESNKFSRVDVLRLLSVLTVNLKRVLLCCCRCCCHRQSTENVGEC